MKKSFTWAKISPLLQKPYMHLDLLMSKENLSATLFSDK